jgi:uncharacterized protein YkwD
MSSLAFLNKKSVKLILNKVFLLLCIITLTNSLGACSYDHYTDDQIDIKKLDEPLLEALLVIKLNELRKKHSLPELELDLVLQKAAKDQATFLATGGQFGHFQKDKRKNSPMDRVIFYGGKYPSVGENILSTYIGVPVKAPIKSGQIIIKTYQELADNMFMAWTESPHHLDNMLLKNFRRTGARFAIDEKNHEIFASQVFASEVIAGKD